MSLTMKSLTHAAGHALIDMEVEGWGSAIETNYGTDGWVVVTFARKPVGVPTTCSCSDDEEEDCCDFCMDGGFVDSEYLEVTLAIAGEVS